jgi:DNA-binding GntR family transcriptional regulator
MAVAAAPRTRRGSRVASPLYELIYSVLREHIVGGRFPRGLVLGETTVARAFRASRVPAGAALKRLHREGLIRDFDGRGYLANPGRDTVPVRLDLAAAGLVLQPEVTAELAVRNRRERIYPEVEHSVAACLSYGRFLLNESALAEHYEVSRTVAHEVLTRLERSGLVTLDVNQRWYAGPLTAELLREHYEMRWLLEPLALEQAMPELRRADLVARRARLEPLADGHAGPGKLERLERELHVETVLICPNRQLRETIRRSQLPIIATHSTFAHTQARGEIATMVAEHHAIFDHLLAGRMIAAKTALEQHLRRSLEPNVALLRHLGPLPEDRRPPYLIPA